MTMLDDRTRTPDGLILGFAGDDAGSADRPHLSVDGMTPSGPNLSHWPGNRTPPRFKADLSTGICFRFVRAPDRVRRDFLGDAEIVLNDHYDTDGFCSLLAILRPEVALQREEICLAAATTGDFQVYVSPRAFAIDRTVLRLATPESPVAASFAGLSGPAKAAARYRWLLDHAERVLDRPQDFERLWVEEHAEIEAGIDRGLRGDGITVEHHRDEGLAVVRSRGPCHRMVLNTLAGCHRVLHLQHDAEGTRIRYHDRTESWFDLVSIQPPRRRDLRPIATRLDELCGTAGAAVCWTADAPEHPIPELYFGVPSEQAYGDVSRQLAPISDQGHVNRILDEVRGSLRSAPPAEGIARDGT